MFSGVSLWSILRNNYNKENNYFVESITLLYNNLKKLFPLFEFPHKILFGFNEVI